MPDDTTTQNEPAPQTEAKPSTFTPTPKPNDQWPDWAWKRVQDADRRTHEVKTSLASLQAQMKADREARAATDAELKDVNQQILEEFAQERERRVVAERTAALASMDVKDTAAQARLIREYDLATASDEDPKSFNEWIADAKENDPFISAYFKMQGSGTTETEQTDGETEDTRPPATRTRRTDQPPAANGGRYTDEAVNAMDPAAKRRHAPKIARALLAEGKLKMSPALQKRLGLIS